MKIPFLFKSEVAKNFLTFVPSGILLLVVAPLEADPHHDGVILAPAIAFSENLPAHVGAFSQYGPLSPILSGMWLKLTEANLISLRYLAALQAIFLAVGLFLVLKNVIKVEFARLFTLFWIFASGIWATRFPGALMAWPSLLSTLLLIFALLLALKAVKVISTKSTLYLYTSGLLIAIAGFARAQSWAIAGAIGLTLIFTTAKSYKKLVILCFGYVCGFGVIFGYLLSSNAVEAWWLQSIYWPTQIYPDIGQGNNYNRFQMLLYLIEGALLILLIFVAGLVQNRFSGRLAALFITLFTISSLVIGYIVPTLTSIPIRYRVLFGEPLERILVSPFYLSVLASMFLTLQQIRKEKKDRERN